MGRLENFTVTGKIHGKRVKGRLGDKSLRQWHNLKRELMKHIKDSDLCRSMATRAYSAAHDDDVCV